MTYTFLFDADLSGKNPRDLLGGKGAGLNEMTRLGIPVPPGFTLSTEVCTYYRDNGQSYPDALDAEVEAALKAVEEKLGRRLGDVSDPLLVSVRSGARVSMPGMMDTVLNLGLNNETVKGLAEKSGDERFAYDAYRRLLQMYGDVVLEVPHEHFEGAIRGVKKESGNERALDSELSVDSLKTLVERYLEIIKTHGTKPFPQDVREQLWDAIGAVFRSWDNQRAIRYRRMQGISASWGTACTVQAMVFGNLGQDSGSGVAFTRNPSTGERVLYGEYLANAQGEDVVAGIRTPQALMASAAVPGKEDETLERRQPETFDEIRRHAERLEQHFGDMQDVEFTVERGTPYILQTRTGKRTAHAAVRIAVDLVSEGAIDKDGALLQVNAASLDQLLHARLPTPDELEAQGVTAVAKGLPASPGAATGQVVFDADEAERLKSEGKDVVLVRRETSPEDIHGMQAAVGILTATGGMTSHAAVVARGLGKCCVAGCGSLTVDYAAKTATAATENGTVVFKEGDLMSLDGTYGRVYKGALDVVPAATIPEFEELMSWADEARRLRIRANADTPKQARQARAYGAQGIGLCRTEHMFFAEERLEAVRCLVLADSDEERQKWLEAIEPMQQADFEGIFRAMDGLPVTVRLLDWPLHEFLPKEDREFEAVSAKLGVDAQVVKNRAAAMHEINPMLGHRAVRVGLTLPAIYRTQVRALLRAAAAVSKDGVEVLPEIMIPVVSIAKELEQMVDIVRAEADATLKSEGSSQSYAVGTMIELPRACLAANELAKCAEFFSFGTNDLTQTTFGFSRDDAGRFLPLYVDELELLPADPFSRLDEDGVGQLVSMACERGRSTRPDIKLGLCGEHGGDPESIDFCERVGLAYVSCSPPRLPIARLAAGQAAIRNRKN